MSAPRKSLAKRLLGPPYRLLRRVLVRLNPVAVWRLARWVADVFGAVRQRRREPRLTVGVDVRPLWEPLSGVGWYLDRLLRELAARDDVALRLYGATLAADEEAPEPSVPLPEGPGVELVQYSTPPDAAIHQAWLIRLLRKLGPLLVAADGNRVIFAPNFFPTPRMQPAVSLGGGGGGRLVATVHDLAFRRFPWTVREETLDLLGRHLDRTLHEAARIITPSEAIRAEIARARLVPADRIRAIHHGPGQLADLPGDGPPAWAPERYALFVGTLEPRKNLETLLEACLRLRRRRDDAPDLVLCGRLGWKDEALRRRIDRAAAEGWLHRPGYVPAAELAALYRHSLLLAFPSHYEGFGLPLLEAFAAGTPVVASDLPVFREVAADAALYAPADRPDIWVERIEEVLDRPERARELAERGRARAAGFTWRASAERHLELFREVAERS